MGKANKKGRKAVEENEFLKDLMDEVQSLDDSDSEVADDSLSIVQVDDADNPGELIMNAGGGKPFDSYSNGNEELPTVFANIQNNIPAPELKSSQGANGSPSEATIAEPQDSIATVATAADTKATQSSQFAQNSTALNVEPDRTVAVAGARGNNRPALQEKVVAGSLKGTRSGQVYTSLDASLAQAETLKMAQTRIKELEIEVDRLRQENDDLASAGDVVTKRMEDLQVRLQRLEKEKTEQADRSKSEMLILKGNLQFKDSELAKAKAKAEDLDMRIKSDFRKIRVRERELENRLELIRGEKQALMRTKDEKILDLQRKLDQYKSEMDLYRAKVQDLNKLMESQRDQMQKTIRALRIALTNLEHDDSTETASLENSAENVEEDSKKAQSS